MLINYIKHLYLLIVFQSFLFSLTSTISGTVLDFETQEPIKDVSVFIKSHSIGAKTDYSGYFFLLTQNIKQKQILLNIKMIGYEEKVVSVDLLSGVIDLGLIFINKKPIELEPLDIHSHKSQSSQISDIIISDKELNENLKGNIANTLSSYPNIGINCFGSVVSKPSLRGFSGDRFLLTKDGVETGDLSQSSIDHVITLDMSEVTQIEIIRGPRSLVYGLNAIGGIVNTSLIGSPDIRVNQLYQKLSIGGESYNNGIYGNMMFYIPFKNNQVNIFLSNRNTGNEISSIGELPNTNSNVLNYKFGFTNYQKKSYINFVIENFNMGYGIPPNPGGHISGVDILLNKKSAQINYHQDLSYNIFSQLDIKYNFIDYIHLELVNESVDSDDIFEIFDNGDFHVALAKETHNFQLELSSENSVLGLELNSKNFEPSGFYLSPDTNEAYLSIYGFRDKKNSNLDVNFLSSFRLGYFSSNPKTDNIQYVNLESSDVKKRNFTTVSLSCGFKKKINKVEFNTWIMHTMRPPRVEELYSDGPHLGSYAYEIGNPNLGAEKIYGIENSLIFNDNPFKFSFITFYNYSPYYYEMAKMGDCEFPDDWQLWETHPCYGADFIEWGSGGYGWLYKYNSRGSEAIIKGLEVDFEYKLEKFLLSYNLSFVEGDNETIDRPLSYMNPMKQILSFDYSNKFVNYKVRFSKIHAQNRLGEFETYTPGTFLTDFIISFKYKMHNIALQLNNIFDEKYYNHLSRIKNITPEAGKNINLVYKVSF